MQKIKIAYINVMDRYSGGEIVLQRIIHQLDKNKFDVLVYTKKTKFVDTMNYKDINVVVFDTQFQMRGKRGIKAFLKATKLFAVSGKYIFEIKFKHKADIVHSNSLTSNIYFVIWAKLFNLKFIAHSHEIKEGFLFKIIHKYIGFCADKIIVVSNAVKKNWLKDGVNKNKIKVIYNGVDDDFF